MVLRKIYWLRKGGVTGNWKKLHNEELPDLYFLLQNSKGIRNRLEALWGKPKKKGGLELGGKWENIIKKDLQETLRKRVSVD